MRVRLQLCALLLGLLGPASGLLQASASGTLLSSILIRSSSSNGTAPAGVDLSFDSASQPIITLSLSLDVNSLKFGDNYYAYSFRGNNGAILAIDSGGINFSSKSESDVSFDSSLGLQLLSSQTWMINGSLDVASDIAGPERQAAGVDIESANKAVLSRVTLSGNNTYTGGTTIGPHIELIAANNHALGSTGAVTLNGGTLAASSGVNLAFDSSHPLVLNSGTLTGTGTFSVASSIDVKSSLDGAVVLSPGLELPGQLNFSLTSGATLIFDSGGTYHWKLRDATTAGGWDSISVAGPVNITASAATPFNLVLEAVGPDGQPGSPSNFSLFSSYSWTILTAQSITGFDPTKFNITTNDFLQSSGGGTFSLRLDSTGTSLVLDFAPIVVPEPSTWALLLSGIGITGVVGLRRRFASRS